jgi:hypothetical protein
MKTYVMETAAGRLPLEGGDALLAPQFDGAGVGVESAYG